MWYENAKLIERVRDLKEKQPNRRPYIDSLRIFEQKKRERESFANDTSKMDTP